MPRKTGIILANTGTPDSPEPDEIEAYLRQFLMDPRIRQMPLLMWKWLLNKHILPARKHKSSERYKLIWREEGSPLILDQQELATKVQALFDSEDDKTLVRIGMSYGRPSIEDVLRQFMDEGVERVVLLPLYPQSAYSPTQAVIDSFKRALQKTSYQGKTVVIDNYHDNERYLDAVAQELVKAGYSKRNGDKLLLSMHSIPLKDVEAGDTYLEQTEHTAQLLAQRLGVEREDITVGFQSVFGHKPEKWAGPLSLDILAKWKDEGDERVVFMCPGFSIDCLETLYDIPYEMCPALEGEGVRPADAKRFVWVKCLGPSDEHARIVKDVLDRNMR